MQVRRLAPAASTCQHDWSAMAALGSRQQSRTRQSVATAAAGDSGGGAGDLPDLRELTKDDFHSCLEEAGDQLVVIDFFTDW